MLVTNLGSREGGFSKRYSMIKILSFLSVGCLFGTVNANMAPAGFERFPNYYFVETGTYGGDGVRFALRAGFPEIHSIDIEEQFVKSAKRSFLNHKNVHIWFGDSSKDLYNIIKDMDKPITFWLDGHRGTPDPAGGKNTPLIEELGQIKRHYIKNHTIIIDDMHCCGDILFDYLTREDIANKIREINPAYVITYVAGGGQGEYPDNIMVAYVQ